MRAAGRCSTSSVPGGNERASPPAGVERSIEFHELREGTSILLSALTRLVPGAMWPGPAASGGALGGPSTPLLIQFSLPVIPWDVICRSSRHRCH